MSSTLPSLFISNLIQSFGYSKRFTDNKKIIGILSFIGSSAIYAYGTEKEHNIEIKSKYKYTKSGFTKFMIIDKNDDHYCVNNSMWYLKFDSIEDYNKINVGSIIYIKYYGYRIPILNMFPNIVKSI